MTTQTERRPRRASAPSRAAQRSNQPLLATYFWIRQHCVVPDGFRLGHPFDPYGWQKKALLSHYLVRGDAEWYPDNPLLRTAFVHRMSLVVGPQKLGKDPMEAAQICLEAVGPALFGGFAGKDESYVCADHGCGCGWEYAYDLGEPKGMPWATPLIQLIAVSEEATDNTYSALRPMIEMGPLAHVIPKTGEEFIRLPNGGRIMTVTASAPSRLGARVTFGSMGEAGIYTTGNGMVKVADTVLRNLAGVGGRASLHTNAWDPGEHSLAQQVYEAHEPDVYIQFDSPPTSLSFSVKEERRQILRRVYPVDVRRESGGHVDLAAIESEAVGLALRDPAQAARFFGNQLVAGGGKAFDAVAWNLHKDSTHAVPRKAQITLGFDGSVSGDWSALVATELLTGFQWPLGIWNPAKYGGEIDPADVNATVDAAFSEYSVVRFYADPPYWKEEVAGWQGRYGDKVVIGWETYRPKPIAWAVRNYAAAIAAGTVTNDGDVAFAMHIGNAYKRPLLARDDKGEPMWTIQKETPNSGNKIDIAMAGLLSWEARTDAIAAGVAKPRRRSYYEDNELFTVG